MNDGEANMLASHRAFEVFCFSAPEYELYRKQLETHASVLKRQGLISHWHNRQILPPIWMIPYPRNPFFLGRDEHLSLIHVQLRAGEIMALSQPQAISGLGGIGKTQIAVEYAYRYSQEYQTVLWARAESIETLNSSYSQLAVKLNLPEREAEKEEIIVAAVKQWLQDHHHCLLILDNADELALLQDFLPPGVSGHLLITTRAGSTGRLA